MQVMTSKLKQPTNDGEIVRATIDEVRSDRTVDARHVLRRLNDWKVRVHRLFDFIEDELGDDFTYDRTGKHQSEEELVQRAGLSGAAVPALDILRIEKPAGSLRAIIIPRGLWVIGANGRLDLRVLRGALRQEQYFLIDKSQPLSGPENADWYLASAADRLDQQLLTGELVREVIGTSA
ncbi:MAG: hypothetical protein ABSE69_04385 [Roseiarcus sp.]|jgi:hypothetical protein